MAANPLRVAYNNGYTARLERKLKTSNPYCYVRSNAPMLLLYFKLWRMGWRHADMECLDDLPTI